MSNDKPKSPNWKNNAGGGQQPAKNSRKPWQHSHSPASTGPVDPRARFRKRLFLAAITGSLLIAALVIVVLFWWPVKPPGVLAVAPETTVSLSGLANVYGANSAQAVAELSGKDNQRPRAGGDARSGRDSWKEALGTPKEKTLLLYFAAHGAVDKKGPYLWMPPADAVGIDELHKLYVREILDHLATLDKEKQKLVIFDATQVTSSWAHGFLHNDFARGLKALDGAIASIDNLVVISSSDEDQRSWVCEEWRRTAFGHYLETGLRNEAEGKNQRLHALALFDGLKKSVSEWARANRDAEQSPILLPSAQGREKAEKIVIVRDSDAKTSPPMTEAVFSYPTELRRAWETAEVLAKREPPPETTAPSLWRIYLDTLLRWEHLARAGAPTEIIQRRAEQLAEQLGKRLFVSGPPCLANSFAVAPALGIPEVGIDTVRFGLIWKPKDGQKEEDIWREMLSKARAEDAERGPTLLRLSAGQEVLRLVIESGTRADVLERAAEVLKIVDETQPRPIETHFLLMLKQFIERPQLSDPALQVLLTRALKVRIEAERVAWLAGAPGNGYAYAEQVHRWIETSVKKADRQRRLGEDLLFAVDGPSWKRAETYFSKAEEGYRQCTEQARAVASALRLRDRVMARLPYYARWVASYRGRLVTEEVDKLLERVEQIAASSHDLSEKLEDVPSISLNDVEAEKKLSTKLETVNKLTSDLTADFTRLEADFKRETQALTSTADTSNWHGIDAVLTVPFLSGAQREKLLLDLRSISRDLLRINGTQPGAKTATPVDAKTVAQRQGRMAVALLGERWIEDAEVRQAARGTLTLHRDDLLNRIRKPDPSAWWESLREAGEQIGWHYRQMSSCIQNDVVEAGQIELARVPKLLARASAVNRMLDSATPTTTEKQPAVEERHYWTHRLLLWQARRTSDDGWAAHNPGPATKPYCEEASERYAFAAQLLILGSEAREARAKERRLDEVTKTRAFLQAPTFTADWKKTVDLEENRKWEIAYKATPAPGLAVGFPILRLQPAPAPIRLFDNAVLTRQPIVDFVDLETVAGNQEKRIVYALDENLKSAAGIVKNDLLYRGHVLPMETHVLLDARPNVKWIYNPPKGAGRFAIFGSPELQRGAVCLMLDVTLSMWDRVNPNDNQSPFKIDEAVKALERVIADLPEGVQLSVGVFHGTNDFDLRLQWLQKPFRFEKTPASTAALIERIRDVKKPPYAGSTPLAVMLEEVILKGGAFPENFRGFQSIVVLTDGTDNVSNQPGQKVLNALLDKRTKDIALHMIFFGLEPNENQKALLQFSAIQEEESFETSDRTPGRIWPAIQKREDLVNALRSAMLPHVQILQDGRRVLKGMPISLTTELAWVPSPTLDPSKKIEISTPGRRQRLHLEPGDRLWLEMYQAQDGLGLRVPLYADVRSHLRGKPRKDSDDGLVRLTLTRNGFKRPDSFNDLQMVATLQRKARPDQRELTIERPAFVWFEVTPRGASDADKPDYLEIENLHDRVAPSWVLKSTTWPSVQGKSDVPASPTVQAWWIDAFPGEHGDVPFTRLDQLDAEMAKLRARYQGKDIEFTVDRNKVTVESITVEGSYLYFRARHSANEKVVVRLQGLKREDGRSQPGEEHRFHEKTNKYVAIFGPIEKSDYEKPITLQIFTLSNLKNSGKSTPVRFDAEKPSNTESDDEKYMRMNADK